MRGRRCGWGSQQSKEAFLFGSAGDQPNFIAYVSSNWAISDTGVPLDAARHVFDLARGSLKFDNNEFATVATLGNTAESGQTLYLFAGHVEWTAAVTYYCNMKIYSCQIYSGDTPVRDFVPARRDSDDAVGLYDTVSGGFFTNGGTGHFIASGGSASTYTAVEYIESDGNQYIDTQFTLNNTHAATLDFQPTVLPTVSGGTDPNGSQSLFGCRNNYNSKNIAILVLDTGLYVDFRNSNGGEYRIADYALSTSTRYAVAAAAGTRYVCNKSTAEATAQASLWSIAFTCAGTAYLFVVNNQSASGAPLWNKAKMKLFGGTIVASDGTLLCKFVPCLRNGVEPGIYDPVRDLFLPNIGTGSFTYGAATGVVYGGTAASPSAVTIDPTNYECSMTITPVADSVSTTLSNFPLLVRLSAARQIGFNPADCGTGGADLRFALSDGTLLSHEIDTWSTTGSSGSTSRHSRQRRRSSPTGA